MADAQWGKLEQYAEKMAQIQGSAPARAGKKGLYLFAGDSGIVEAGISSGPAGFTLQKAREILSGKAAINAIAPATGWEIILVDAGISGEIPDSAPVPGVRLLRKKTALSGGKFGEEPALQSAELDRLLEAGDALAADAAEQGYTIAGAGAFGAGGGEAAGALLVAAGFLPEDMIGRDGADDAQFARKKEIIINAVNSRNCDSFDPEDLLVNFGTPALAMLSGFISGLEGKKIAGVLDGYAAAAAAWTAWLSSSKISKYLFAGHLAAAPGHRIILEHLMLDPVVSFELGTDEGAGAAIGGHIVALACTAKA